MKTPFILAFIFLLSQQLFSEQREKTTKLILAQFESPLLVKKHSESGIIIKMIKDIYAAHNIDVVIEWDTVKNVLDKLEKNKADFSLGHRKTLSREQKFIFSSAPLIRSSTLFFHLKSSSFSWTTINDLTKIKIGAIAGTISMGEQFLEAEKKQKIDVARFENQEQNFRNLFAGKIDVAVGTPIIINSILKNNFTEEQRNQIVTNQKPLSSYSFYTIFSKDTAPEIIDIYNTGMKKLKENGEYYRIINSALNQ